MALKFERMSFLVFPTHSNHMGTLFGGVILERIDICAGITARRALYNNGIPLNDEIRVLTRHMDEIDFRVPGYTGDLIFLTGEVVEVGNSSLKIRVTVEKEDMRGRKFIMTTANVVMCLVDHNNLKFNHGLKIDREANCLVKK